LDLEYKSAEKSADAERWASCVLHDYWDIGARMEADEPMAASGLRITSEEYAALFANYVAQNPEITHVRGQRVTLSDGRVGDLTCFFSEDWTPTGVELTVYDGTEGETQPFSQFQNLPRQKLTITVE
jgi:hypothetical protein